MDAFSIRQSTFDDLRSLHVWLKQEHDAAVHGAFYCNFCVIERAHENGSLYVLVTEADQQPIAFCVGNEIIDLFAVKNEFRGHGYGRALAQWYIDRARDLDYPGLCGECSPSDSLRFWKKLGFTSVSSPFLNGATNWVALPLPRTNDLPSSFTPCLVAVTTSRLATATLDEAPLDEYKTVAADTGDGLLFQTDYVRYTPDPDELINVFRDGVLVFSGKAKYARDVGAEYSTPWSRLREVKDI
jgi:GNAT superfamily N-acetyltransferase